MKKILLLSVLLSVFGLADAELDLIVEKIQKEREGLGLDRLSVTENPFVEVAKDVNGTEPARIVSFKKGKKKVFELKGLMNGTAFINERWYSIDEEINGWTLKYVGKHGVVLTKDKRGGAYDVKTVRFAAKKNTLNLFEKE